MDLLEGYFDFSRRHTIIQIGKFVLTGAANTALDFIVLNILLVIFGVNPTNYAIFKTLAFIIALINSYILNKYWVFKKRRTSDSILKERAMFVGLSVASLILNSIVSSWVFLTMTLPSFTFSPFVAANTGALAGVLVVFLLNFLSYKFVVFKS